MIARRASGSRSIWSIDSPTARTTDSGTSPSSSCGSSVTRRLRRAISARGTTTAIEAANPKRNQSKTGECGRGRLRRRQGRDVADRRRARRRLAGPSLPAGAETRTRSRARGPRASHRPGRASPPAGSIPARRWRSGTHRVSSRCGVGTCGSRSAPARCKARRQVQRRAPRRRSRGDDDRLPSPGSQGEAALVIPMSAASRKLTTTTAATGNRPHSARASPSITRSLRCSLIADL